MKAVKNRKWFQVMFFLVMLTGLLSGCGHMAKTAKHKPSQPLPPAPVVTGLTDSEIVATPEESGEEEGLGETNGPEEIVPSNTKALLTEARNLTVAGLEHYRNKEFDDAKLALDNAEIKLMEADIPEEMKVLSLLGVNLPEAFQDYDLVKIIDQLETLTGDDQLKDDDTFIECQIRRMALSFGEPFPDDESLTTLKHEINRYIRYFQTEGRDFYTASYMRMHKYRPMIIEIFNEKGLPEDLVYKALIESGFKSKAYSRAQARGIWQFIPGTGQRYGLRISRSYDERLDPVKSTVAAREYMLDLIGIFGSKSFFLAMAAYNAGEHKVSNCLRTLDDPFKDRTFWHIKDCLARETQEYIPKIMAAAMIAKDPRRFGFDLPTIEEMEELFDIVIIPNVTSLSKVAGDIGISTEMLRDLNPDIASNSSNTPVNNFPVYVPKDIVLIDTDFMQPMEDFVASIDTTAIMSTTIPPEREPRQDVFEYTFQQGNTLQLLATWFKVSESTIREFNPDKGYPVAGDKLAIPAGDPAIISTEYRIRNGDNLQKIANLFCVDYKALAGWNGLIHPYRINAGKMLRVYAPKVDREVQHPENQIVYTVKPGNYLHALAEVFEVSYDQIMTQNNLRKSRLAPGQKLIIKTPKPLFQKIHVVSKGEALQTIARKYGVTVKDILVVNGLNEKSRLAAGQELTVYSVKP